MTYIIGIAAIVIGIAEAFLAFIKIKCHHDLYIFIYSYCGGVLIILGSAFIKTESPKAIDVYRNKTTLQITYRDNVPTDTTVVYK